MAQYTAMTLSGDTNGTFIGVDYTGELNAIASALEGVRSELTTMNQSITGQNTTFNANFTAAFQAGSHLNLGTISNVLNAVLVEQSAGHAQVARSANALTAIGAAMVEGNDNVGGKIASGLAQLNASQAVQIAQNSKKTAFEQAATQAALERSGLPPVEVPQPDIENVIKEAVGDATIVSAQTKATGFVTTQIDEALSFGTDVVTNQISQFQFVQNATLKWNNFTSSLTGDTPVADKGEAGTRDTAAQALITGLANTGSPPV